MKMYNKRHKVQKAFAAVNGYDDTGQIEIVKDIWM